MARDTGNPADREPRASEIAWDAHVPPTRTVRGRDFLVEHVYTLEHRALAGLRAHETVSAQRLRKMAGRMRSGDAIGLIEIAEDGQILDGHARAVGARKLLGGDAIVPVVVHRVHRLTPEAQPEADAQPSRAAPRP